MDINSIDKYFINDVQEQKIWKDCIFVFDTSALLNFYHYSPQTKEFIFDKVFLSLKDRLWIPNHVEFEYLKNRTKILRKTVKEKYGVLKEENISALIETAKKYDNQLKDLKNRTCKNFSHPYIDNSIIEKHEKVYEKFKESSAKLFEELNKEIDKRSEEILSQEEKDTVLESFNKHLQAGKSFTYDQLIKIAEEGQFRYANKIPPGYEDLNDKDKLGLQVYGDLFIWKQILEYARVVNKPIVFITDDVKTDWCYSEKSSGETRITRPREELIKEINDYAEIEFWMYTLSQFLHNIEKYYSIKLEEDVASEIKTSAKQNLIHIGKLYYYMNEEGKYYGCLRFFENNVVVSVSITTTLGDVDFNNVLTWLNESGKYVSKGEYKIEGNSISFVTKSSSGSVVITYNGSIDGNSIQLTSKSSNGYEATRVYTLYEQ